MASAVIGAIVTVLRTAAISQTHRCRSITLRIVTAFNLDTPRGRARVHLQKAPEPRGALILGQGAGGGVAARDLVAGSGAAEAAGFTVALVEQPYRVAGRRSPAPAGHLDEAW